MLLKLSFLQGDTEHLQHCMNLLDNRDSSDFTSKIMPNELNYPQRTLTICCGYQQPFFLFVFLRAIRGKGLQNTEKLGPISDSLKQEDYFKSLLF